MQMLIPRRRAHLLDQRLAACIVDVADNHRRAVGRPFAKEGLAEAGGAAGDEDRLFGNPRGGVGLRGVDGEGLTDDGDEIVALVGGWHLAGCLAAFVWWVFVLASFLLDGLLACLLDYRFVGCSRWELRPLSSGSRERMMAPQTKQQRRYRYNNCWAWRRCTERLVTAS